MRPLVIAAIVVALVAPPAAGAWTWPADGPVLRAFVFGDNPYLGGQHRGIDVGGPPGSAVHAPAGGAVSFAGSLPSNGKTVTIQTDDGYAVTLVHLGSIGATRGAAVAEGSAVGTVGPSGDAEVAEPYVHLGVRVSADPQGYVDPLTLLPARGSAVTTPAPGASTSTPPAAPAAPLASAAGQPSPPSSSAPPAVSTVPATVRPLAPPTPAAGAAAQASSTSSAGVSALGGNATGGAVNTLAGAGSAVTTVAPPPAPGGERAGSGATSVAVASPPAPAGLLVPAMESRPAGAPAAVGSESDSPVTPEPVAAGVPAPAPPPALPAAPALDPSRLMIPSMAVPASPAVEEPAAAPVEGRASIEPAPSSEQVSSTGARTPAPELPAEPVSNDPADPPTAATSETASAGLAGAVGEREASAESPVPFSGETDPESVSTTPSARPDDVAPGLAREGVSAAHSGLPAAANERRPPSRLRSGQTPTPSETKGSIRLAAAIDAKLRAWSLGLRIASRGPNVPQHSEPGRLSESIGGFSHRAVSRGRGVLAAATPPAMHSARPPVLRTSRSGVAARPDRVGGAQRAWAVLLAILLLAVGAGGAALCIARRRRRAPDGPVGAVGRVPEERRPPEPATNGLGVSRASPAVEAALAEPFDVRLLLRDIEGRAGWRAATAPKPPRESIRRPVRQPEERRASRERSRSRIPV